jgi:hypothetical protein
MKYAASRKTDIIQIYMNISEVPYVTVHSRIRDIIEDDEAIAMLLTAPGTSKIGIRLFLLFCMIPQYVPTN